MEEYYPVFVKQEIELEMLEDLTEKEVMSYGLPYGAAQKILSNFKQQAEEINVIKDITLGTKLGEGHFGEVYEGDWQGAQVALKKLVKSEAADEFLKESKVLTKLRRNIQQHLSLITQIE